MNKKPKAKSVKSRAGRGSHGSITKAGKVRDQTPKIPKSRFGGKDHPIKRRRKLFKRATTCPNCRFRIQVGATVCRRCGEQLVYHRYNAPSIKQRGRRV
jgi:ribosomal protein S30